jgi:hypothetical protein
VPDAIRIAAVRHHIGKPPANSKLALRLPQQQPESENWLRRQNPLQISCCERSGRSKGSSVSSIMAAVSEGWTNDALRLYTNLLRESLRSHHCRHTNFYLPIAGKRS